MSAMGAAAADVVALARRFDDDPDGVRLLLAHADDGERLSMLLAAVALLSTLRPEELEALAALVRIYAMVHDSGPDREENEP